MDSSFTENLSGIKNKFLTFVNADEKYAYLIELGRVLSPYPLDQKKTEWIVPGCQSTLYLHTQLKNGKLFFLAHSDALISAGLAALLMTLYNGCSPQEILFNPPTFLQEIGLLASLSPNRSNGLASIYQRMKQEALKSLLPNATNKITIPSTE